MAQGTKKRVSRGGKVSWTAEAAVDAFNGVSRTALALRFARILKKHILSLPGGNRKSHLREVIENNRLPAYQGCCASHDHCDANMAMDEALTAFRPMLPPHNDCNDDFSDAASEAWTGLWNEAWDIAKRNEFWWFCPKCGKTAEAGTVNPDSKDDEFAKCCPHCDIETCPQCYAWTVYQNGAWKHLMPHTPECFLYPAGEEKPLAVKPYIVEKRGRDSFVVGCGMRWEAGNDEAGKANADEIADMLNTAYAAGWKAREEAAPDATLQGKV